MTALLRRILLCTAIWALCLNSWGAPARALVLVPGILGSKICDRTSGQLIWGGTDSFKNLPDLLLPDEFDSERLQQKSCGIIDSVQILGPWKIKKYDDLLKTLTDLGYVLDKSLFVFDYDWRLSNTINAERLAAKVEVWAKGSEIDIVAHSMGGIIAKLYISNPTNKDRVRKFMTLGTPYQGSVTTIETIDLGFGFWSNLQAMGRENVHRVALSFPSLYELLPNYKSSQCCFWRSRDGRTTAFDILDPKQWEKLDFLPEEFRLQKKRAWLVSTLSRAKAVQDIMSKPLPVSVQRWTIVNGLIDTPWKATITDYSPTKVEYLTWKGDGTVIDYSASDWNVFQARPSNSEHQRIFADDSARQTIRWIFGNDKEPTAGPGTAITAFIEGADKIRYRVSGIAYRIEPSVVRSGESTRLILKLSGDEDLSKADLSNISIESPITTNKLQTIHSDTSQEISFNFNAPTSSGAHSVSFVIPGIGRLEEILMVIGSER